MIILLRVTVTMLPRIAMIIVMIVIKTIVNIIVETIIAVKLIMMIINIEQIIRLYLRF